MKLSAVIESLTDAALRQMHGRTNVNDTARSEARRVVVAVLGELKQPTDNMCGFAKHRHPEISREQARGIWHSMMDEAINGA